jgi:hypothetical protein
MNTKKLLPLAILIVSMQQLLGMDNKKSPYQKLISWIKENPKKTGISIVATGYLVGTPGGRELLCDSFKETTNIGKMLITSPKELARTSASIINEKFPL